MFAGQFNGSFIRFRSTVAEEYFVGTTVVGEPFRQSSLLGNKVQVTDVMHLIHLISDGLRQFVVGVA
jgi:hypothetical protein